MVVMLRQCCCGCSLKTGTIIIGVLNLIFACIGVANGIVVASRGKEMDQPEGAKAIGIATTVFSAVLVLIAILLIIGAVKSKPALLVPWMICAIIIMVATVIMYLVIGVGAFQHHQSEAGASYIIGAIIYVLLETYFILVVYSLYRELRGTA